METVQASLLDSLKKTINKLFSMFDKLVDKGMQILDTEEGDDGETIVKLKAKDGQTFFIAQKEMKPNIFNVRVYDQAKTKQYQKPNLNVKDVPKFVAESLKEGWDIDINDTAKEDETVKSNKVLKMTLKRVVGSKEDEIHLVNIFGNYEMSEMKNNMDMLLNDEAFIAAVDEEPNTFEIVDNGDDFDVEQCTETCDDPSACAIEAANAIIAQAYVVILDLQYMHWNAKGEYFDDIHRASDNVGWSIRSAIDTMSELVSEYGGIARHPLDILKEVSVDSCSIPVSGKEALDHIRLILNNYADCLDFWAVNFQPDVQQMLLNWARDARANANFFIKNKLDDGSAPAIPVNPTM